MVMPTLPPGLLPASTQTSPPGLLNFTALSSRLTKACSSRILLPITSTSSTIPQPRWTCRIPASGSTVRMAVSSAASTDSLPSSAGALPDSNSDSVSRSEAMLFNRMACD